MRNLSLSILALILVATPLGATLNDPDDAVTPDAELAVIIEAPPQVDTGMNLDLIVLEERSSTSDDASVAQDLPARGSFWWLVGVVVVAGVILALLL